jgi:hypothetical protein
LVDSLISQIINHYQLSFGSLRFLGEMSMLTEYMAVQMMFTTELLVAVRARPRFFSRMLQHVYLKILLGFQLAPANLTGHRNPSSTMYGNRTL